MSPEVTGAIQSITQTTKRYRDTEEITLTVKLHPKTAALDSLGKYLMMFQDVTINNNLHPRKRWKIGPIDIASRGRWSDYSRAKDAMFTYTDIEEAPWYMVGADVKRHARLNCIHHLLQAIPWQEIPDEEIELPDLQKDPNYRRPPIDSLPWVPEVYGSGATESG